jgi:membrane protein DedA with SNARE-associated domain
VLPSWSVAFESWVPVLAESLWVYPVMTALAALDGVVPVVPSESVIIALASLSMTHGSPHVLLIALAAAAGAFLGDQVAYLVGSRITPHRLRLFRTRRGRQVLAWTEHELTHRGSAFILAARFMPVARVAVDLTAGALGYPRRRFLGLTVIASLAWAGLGTIVGAGAGFWLSDHPVVAPIAGVVSGALLGLGIDRALRRWTRPATLGRCPSASSTPRESCLMNADQARHLRYDRSRAAERLGGGLPGSDLPTGASASRVR